MAFDRKDLMDRLMDESAAGIEERELARKLAIKEAKRVAKKTRVERELILGFDPEEQKKCDAIEAELSTMNVDAWLDHARRKDKERDEFAERVAARLIKSGEWSEECRVVPRETLLNAVDAELRDCAEKAVVCVVDDLPEGELPRTESQFRAFEARLLTMSMDECLEIIRNPGPVPGLELSGEAMGWRSTAKQAVRTKKAELELVAAWVASGSPEQPDDIE